MKCHQLMCVHSELQNHNWETHFIIGFGLCRDSLARGFLGSNTCDWIISLKNYDSSHDLLWVFSTHSIIYYSWFLINIWLCLVVTSFMCWQIAFRSNEQWEYKMQMCVNAEFHFLTSDIGQWFRLLLFLIKQFSFGSWIMFCVLPLHELTADLQAISQFKQMLIFNENGKDDFIDLLYYYYHFIYSSSQV